MIRTLSLAVDVATGALVNSTTGLPISTSSRVRLFRGDIYSLNFSILSVSEGIGELVEKETYPVALSPLALYRVGVKVPGSLSTTPLAFAGGSVSENVLSCDIDLNSQAIVDLFDAQESDELDCLLEAESLEGFADATTLLQIPVTILNDVLKETDSEPTPVSRDVLDRLVIRGEDGDPKWIKIVEVDGEDVFEPAESDGMDPEPEPEEINEDLFVRGTDGSVKRIDIAQDGDENTIKITTQEGPEPEGVIERLYVRGLDSILKRINVVQRDGVDTLQILSGPQAVSIIEALYVMGEDGLPRRVSVVTIDGVDTLKIDKE
jgi:hypothetical protein